MKMLFVIIAAVALVACAPKAPDEEPIRSVKLVTVAPGPLDAAHEYAGDIRAQTENRLAFQVSGKLARRLVDVGQAVKAGQVLAELDAQDYALALQSAAAQQQAAQTQRDLAAADLKRFRELQQQGFVSGAEIERREAGLRAADATLQQARSQVALQGNQNRYAVLRAPAAGVVLAVDAEPGQVLAAGTPVLRLAQDGPRDMVFSVPEDRLSQVRVGQAAQVRLWSGADTRRGQVREVAATADALTRTYQVKVALDGVPASLPLGASAHARLQSPQASVAEVIKLPTSSLRQVGSETAVWVLDEASGTVRSRPVQVAGADGNDAVIAAGLRPGEQVVAAGVHVLNEGQVVRVYEARPTAAAAPATATR